MLNVNINPKANANIFVKVLPFLFAAFLLTQIALLLW